MYLTVGAAAASGAPRPEPVPVLAHGPERPAPENYTAANAMLIAAQADIPLTHIPWAAARPLDAVVAVLSAKLHQLRDAAFEPQTQVSMPTPRCMDTGSRRHLPVVDTSLVEHQQG